MTGNSARKEVFLAGNALEPYRPLSSPTGMVVNRTAAALHLDAGKRKRRIVAAEAVSGYAMSLAFLGLVVPHVASLPEFVIEP